MPYYRKKSDPGTFANLRVGPPVRVVIQQGVGQTSAPPPPVLPAWLCETASNTDPQIAWLTEDGLAWLVES